MKTMYQVSARYDKWLEKGITKVNETYLVDARSVTEAEARALEYLKPYVHQSELEIVKVVEIKYQELIEQGESYYYKAKIEIYRLSTTMVRRLRSSIHSSSMARALSMR